MPLWPKRRAFVGHFVSGLVGVMLGVFGIWGTPGVAQTGAPVSQILTLDQDRLFAESLYGKALEARLIVATQALAAENRKMEQDLAAEEADLTKKRPTMAASAFQALADAFDAKVEQVRSDQAAKIEALKLQREQGRKAFFEALRPIKAALLQQMGAFVILNSSAVVAAVDAIDVTDRAILAVNDSLGDGSAPGTTGPRLLAPTDGTALGVTVPAP